MRTVLVHTDIDAAEADLVIGLAKGLPALGVERVVLAHVVDASGLEGPVIMAKVGAVLETMRERAGELTAAGLAVECRVPTGDPERELLALSCEDGVDAILSGSHGKSLAGRLLAGSVSEALATHGSVPNIVVRFESIDAAAEPRSPLETFCERILVPTDFSEPAAHAFELACELASHAGGRVLAVHVDAQVPEADTAERLRVLCEGVAERGADATYSLATGAVSEALLAEADSWKATGVVVGTRGGASPWGELVLGSVALSLLRNSPCPTIIVP